MPGDFGLRPLSEVGEALPHGSERSAPAERSGISSSAQPTAWASRPADQLAPFVYEPIREGGATPISWFDTANSQPALSPASASYALHSFFDDWIHTLASWTQSGSATIGQYHDGWSESWSVSAGGSEPTHGGWNSSS